MRRFLIPAMTIAVLLACGLAHGYLTDRWSNRTEQRVTESRKRLDHVPLNIGMWKGIPRQWPELDQQQDGDKNVTLQYVNSLNGSQVGLLVTAGVTRNLWMWHTPLDCYTAIGFDKVAPEKRIKVAYEGGEGEFFVADFRQARGPEPRQLRVCWAWSGDGTWQAPDFPKIAFGRYPSLFKAYAIREVARPDEGFDDEPCVEFLKEALPRMNALFFAAGENH